MTKRFAVQLLLETGHEQGDVSGITGVPERSVRRIKTEPRVEEFDDVAERQRRRVGRPSKVDEWQPFVEERLSKRADIQTKELLRLAREDGFDGKKTQFYALVKRLRPRNVVAPLVRFEGLPGEFTQHDFGEVDVRFLDGTTKRIQFFASRLKWSRWVEVSIVPNQQVESLVRSLVDHFASMGGVPLVAVFDRPKTVALEWKKDGTVTKWNSTFIDMMNQLSVAAEVCWPYQPRQKGSVENLVGWVKSSFFKQRVFLDDDDLLRQLRAWHVEVNEQTASRATGVTPAERISDERDRFRRLKVRPETLFLRFPIQVGPTGFVHFQGRPYSMHPKAIGLTGTLYLGRDHVRIEAGRFKSEHARDGKSDTPSVLPEHRSARVAEVSGRRGKLYLKRQDLLELGGAMLDYLTEIVHRKPRTWAGDVERMHEQLSNFGEDAMRFAVKRALERRTFGAEYVAFELDQTAMTLAAIRREVMQ